jgi:hypothetical protein
MPANIYSIGALTLTIGVSTVTLPVESWGFSAGIIESTHFHSGNMSPTAITVPGANPRVVASIPFQIAFQTFGLGMAQVTAFSAYLSRFEDYTRDTGATHSRIVLGAGANMAAQIVGWSVSVDGVLYAIVEFAALAADSDTAPLTLQNSVALPALSGSPVLHSLGPIVVNGAIIPGLSASGGQINGSLDVRRSDGDRYPRVAARYQIAPSAGLDHADPNAVLTALGVLGLSLDGTVVCEIYFREYNPTDGIIRAADSIRLGIANGRISYSGVDNRNGSVSSTAMTVQGIVADGDSNPFIVTTGVTAPTVP